MIYQIENLDSQTIYHTEGNPMSLRSSLKLGPNGSFLWVVVVLTKSFWPAKGFSKKEFETQAEAIKYIERFR